MVETLKFSNIPAPNVSGLHWGNQIFIGIKRFCNVDRLLYCTRGGANYQEGGYVLFKARVGVLYQI